MRGAARHDARSFFRDPAQDCIHESRRAGSRNLARQRYGRRDRGVGRNPVERGELVGAEAKDVANPCGDALPSVADERSNRGVKDTCGPQGARRELVGESPVCVRQSRERVVECEIEGAAPVYQLEQAPGGAPRCQPLGQVSIPAIGVDGTATSRRGIRPARNARRPASTA